MTTRIYGISTPHFGDLLIEADDIRDARQRARRLSAYEVWRVQRYRLCELCDSQPCTCSEAARPGGEQ